MASDKACTRIAVKSHVVRDLLQTAAIFKNTKEVVWEYVSNSLEYVDPDVLPRVHVTLDNRIKKIVIADNGRGMNEKDLRNFFIMHGENVDRKLGKLGRGRFGTGKSAAFGIADTLRVTTIKGGKLSKVELRRKDIQQIKSDDPIPVNIFELETETNKSNGTMVEIEDIHLKSLDQPAVIQYIERHLAKWPNATVFVNNHLCEYKMPPAVEVNEFLPEDLIRKKIGDCNLTVKVSGTPLEKELSGISIFSNGILHEVTMAGNEGRPLAQYIFGEIDVPSLDSYRGPISPFDLTRSMKLNQNNQIVQAIYSFVGQKFELVRRRLEKEEKEQKATEEARKLADQAEKIARLINEDFDGFKNKVARARSKGATGFDMGLKPTNAGDDPDILEFGNKEPAIIDSETGGPGAKGGTTKGGRVPRNLSPLVKPGHEKDEKIGNPSGGTNGRKGIRGGFKVQFKNMGVDAYRAHYNNSERTIYINLDHPQLAAAKKNEAIDSPSFLRLAYEVAFSEYAVALAYELDENEEYTDTSDPIFDIRETLNRIARKAAPLYS